MSGPSRKTRPESFEIRIGRELVGLIDRAAALAGKNRPEFVLEAVRNAAEDALINRPVLTVEPRDYNGFLARLNSPAKPNARLWRTLTTPAPWDSEY